MKVRAMALVAMLAITGGLAATTLRGQTGGAEMQLVNRAAQALGGRERLMSIKTLEMRGYGELAYFAGGGNITGSPDAPQKWQSALEYTRTIDLENGRMRTQQRVKMNFVFANAGPQLGLNRGNEVLDGDIAYNLGGGGFGPAAPGPPRPQRASDPVARDRRMQMLANPVTIVRAAMDPSSKLSNLRKQGNLQLVDITVRQGDVLTLAVDGGTNLPAWVSYVVPHTNLGDLTLRTAFVGYQPVAGVKLPMGYNTWSDWRNVIQSKYYIDRNLVDVPVDDMAAPAEVRTPPQPGQGGGGGGGNLQVQKVTDRVWYINGNTIFEFGDHLTMYEANRGDAALANLMKIANSLVPGKRVTEVISSHHHFDHSAGVRAAVAEGLTIISHRGNEQIFREMTTRPARLFPDALGRNMKPMKFVPVDDRLVLKDATNEVHVYHAVGNNHMAEGVFAYVPASGLLVEADFTTQNWDYQWWGGTLMDSIDHYKLKVDTILAVHGQKPLPIAEVVAAIEKQVRGAEELCAKAAAAQFYQPGCPVQYSRARGTN